MPTTTSYECGDMLKMSDVGTKDCHPASGSLPGIQGCIPMRGVAQQSNNGNAVQNPHLDGLKERHNNTMHEVSQRLKHRATK